MTLGAKIRAMREERGLKSCQFARIAGIHHSNLSQWENEICYPRRNNLDIIAAFFGYASAADFERGCEPSAKIEAARAQHRTSASLTINRAVLASNIKFMRESFGLTVQDFADVLNLSRPEKELKIWESGKFAPCPKNIRRLAELLGCTAQDLCENDMSALVKNDLVAKKEENIIGRNIRRMRRARHWSMLGLAVRLGNMEDCVVRKWECGVVKPQKRSIEKLMELFGCEMSDLLREDA